MNWQVGTAIIGSIRPALSQDLKFSIQFINRELLKVKEGKPYRHESFDVDRNSTSPLTGSYAIGLDTPPIGLVNLAHRCSRG